MFLEPHVVVTPQWLEPLLARLEEEPKALVMPSLDVLNKDWLDWADWEGWGCQRRFK
jgi:hypothetical protein